MHVGLQSDETEQLAVVDNLVGPGHQVVKALLPAYDNGSIVQRLDQVHRLIGERCSIAEAFEPPIGETIEPAFVHCDPGFVVTGHADVIEQLMLQTVFPIEYQDEWRDSSSTVSPLFPAISYTITETMVDGWGTLITPKGSGLALRFYETVESYSIMPNVLLGSVTYIEMISVDGIVAEIELNNAGMPVWASYTVEGDDTPTALEPDIGVPTNFQLAQNFPNPFNPNTQISYTLPASSNVRLTISTITGQEVETLVQETQPAGSYEVTFDASNQASGLYLYRLETDQFTQSRMMSLIK